MVKKKRKKNVMKEEFYCYDFLIETHIIHLTLKKYK